jgi:hypothetical protein
MGGAEGSPTQWRGHLGSDTTGCRGGCAVARVPQAAASAGLAARRGGTACTLFQRQDGQCPSTSAMASSKRIQLLVSPRTSTDLAARPRKRASPFSVSLPGSASPRAGARADVQPGAGATSPNERPAAKYCPGSQCKRPLTDKQLRELITAIIEDEGASDALRKHVAMRYPAVTGRSAPTSPKTKGIVAEVVRACDAVPQLHDPIYRRLRVYAVDPSFPLAWTQRASTRRPCKFAGRA